VIPKFGLLVSATIFKLERFASLSKQVRRAAFACAIRALIFFRIHELEVRSTHHHAALLQENGRGGGSYKRGAEMEDGCSPYCMVKTCTAGDGVSSKDICKPTCGDEVRYTSPTLCDSGNDADGNGCSSSSANLANKNQRWFLLS
jgi:hypothetical protein